LASHHVISASRANPLSARSTMRTSGQRSRISAVPGLDPKLDPGIHIASGAMDRRVEPWDKPGDDELGDPGSIR
jgi:hypothetical protein